MRLLLIEDTRVGVTTTTALLSRFGEVRAARSLDEARAVIASGFHPDVIVSDLNLGDGRNWRETFADVVEIAEGRPIAAHTAQTWPELLDEFARYFSGHRAQLFSKRNSQQLIEWLQQFRRDESGSMVQTMDRGSVQSHRDIRAEFVAYLESLGAPRPADDWLKPLIRCIVRWQRRIDLAFERTWQTLLILTVTGVFGWLVMAFAKWAEGGGW